MHDYDIQTTLHDLHTSFHEFKSLNDKRLQDLETHDTSSADLNEKIERIEKSMEESERKLKCLQAATLRPHIAPPEETSHESSTTFNQYIRKGILTPWEQKELSTDPDTEGGYLVPDRIDYSLRQVLQQQSVLRRLASVREISTGSLELLIDKDMADAGWVTEKEAREETRTPELDSIHISVHEMYAKPRATQRLLDDANINVEEWLSQKIAEKMAAMENESFLRGEGVNTPKGLLHHPTQQGSDCPWGRIEEIRTGVDGAFEPQSAVEALIHTFHSLKPRYLHSACWLMSRSAQAAIRKLKDESTGTYVWQPALAEGGISTLLGHPVHTCDDMPSLTPGVESQSIIFGNFKEGYQIVDRQSTRILRDPYSAKPYVEFYTTRRVGGDVVNFEAFKILNFAA